MRFILFFFLVTAFQISAQEQLLFQEPSLPILQLAEYDRPPSISMDSKKAMVLFSYRETYKTLQDFRDWAEKVFIERKLVQNGWNVAKTAQEIDIQRSHLYNKIEKYSLKRR